MTKLEALAKARNAKKAKADSRKSMLAQYQILLAKAAGYTDRAEACRKAAETIHKEIISNGH